LRALQLGSNSKGIHLDPLLSSLNTKLSTSHGARRGCAFRMVPSAELRKSYRVFRPRQYPSLKTRGWMSLSQTVNKFWIALRPGFGDPNSDLSVANQQLKFIDLLRTSFRS